VPRLPPGQDVRRNNGSALIIIDMQRGTSAAAAGRRNNPHAEDNIALLLAAWRAAGAEIVHVRHVSDMPGSPFWSGQDGAAFQPRFEPMRDEHVVEKRVPDAFCGTGLERWLRARDINHLVMVGVSTNNSVESSVRAAGNVGFAVHVVADATFAFEKADYNGVPRTADEVHAMSLANLHGEYGSVVRTADLLSALH